MRLNNHYQLLPLHHIYPKGHQFPIDIYPLEYSSFLPINSQRSIKLSFVIPKILSNVFQLVLQFLQFYLDNH
jgi:hypothetical protein